MYPPAVNRCDRDLLAFYAPFAALAVLGLALPLGIPTGWRVFGLVLIHAVGLPVVAMTRGHDDLVSILRFIWPLSVCMLLPDWFLSAILGTLVFPADGAPRVDTMPLAMAFMWAIPLTVSTWVGFRWNSAWVAGFAGLAIFTSSEIFAPALGLWEPTDKATLVSGVAIYVLPAEWLLAYVTFDVWRRGRQDSLLRRTFDGFLVALMYLGALGVGFLVVERWMSGLL